MAKKPDIIKELEKTIGKKLKQMPLEEIWLSSGNGYAVDDKGFVIGLNLDDCSITGLLFLTQFTRLTQLSLYNNKISDVSPLQGLTALTYLFLSSNRLTDVSPLQGLTALTYLDLDSNQLTDVSPLQGLTALTELYLSSNQLTDVSPLQGLKKLTELRLNSNQLTDVSPLQGLKKLKNLFLKDNKIFQLPEAIFQLGLEVIWKNKYSLKDGIHPYGNPLETPPIEIVKQGLAALQNYFKELTESVPLLQCKLLIVGHGEVGKTTLMKKLIDPNHIVEPGQEPTTHGIHIEPWQITVPFPNPSNQTQTETVKLHFWDFGGQAIYHSTHQFFLTKRSLYLFVWEVRKEEETLSFDYWLNILKLLSDQSPVIIVMNKADHRRKSIDEDSFQAKFPFIKDFFQISCLTAEGLPALTQAIRQNLATMPHLQDKLPLVWTQIHHHLLNEKDKNKKDYISQSEYLTICQKYGLNEERAFYLSSYLHDLGAILHFQSDPFLAETVILNPEWATEAVYTLIDTPEVQQNCGRFEFSQLRQFWNPEKFPPDKHLHLTRLMEKFELCFNFAGTTTHFVPELLPPLKSDVNLVAFQETKALRFLYRYDFMPEGIVNRLMARLFYLIHDRQFWKNGVIFIFEESSARVQAEPLHKRVVITIIGHSKQELLAILRSHLEHIHESLNMKKEEQYNEMVPCTCTECSASTEPFFHAYGDFQKARAKNKSQLQCKKSFEDIPIQSLLTQVQLPQPHADLLETMITTASRLQGRTMTIKTDEDSRNSYIADILDARGFKVKDQTRWGRSSAGKRDGEVDIKLESQDGRALAIIEAFILKGIHHQVIAEHLQKFFGYDVNGLGQGFVLIYVEHSDFAALWQQYLLHVEREVPFGSNSLQGPLLPHDTSMAHIKVARAQHLVQNQPVSIYHIFINMTRS